MRAAAVAPAEAAWNLLGASWPTVPERSVAFGTAGAGSLTGPRGP